MTRIPAIDNDSFRGGLSHRFDADDGIVEHGTPTRGR